MRAATASLPALLFPEPTVATHCDGVPVYAYGYTHVLGASPDLVADARLQAGNAAPLRKVPLKRSGRIRANRLGGTTPRLPRTPANDYLPLECIHLIDGDPRTCWSSRSVAQAGAEPAWIRLDLAGERPIAAVVLRKRQPGAPRHQVGSMPLDEGAAEVGMAMPGHLEVRVARDGMTWETVFAGPSGDTPAQREFRCTFPARPAKQIWIVGTQLQRVENWHFSFSVAAAEVLDAEGRNLALASLGTGVTVSSTQHSGGQTREEHHRLWPLFADLGLKWIRIGYHDDPVNWHWVEQEKGQLRLDPEADAALTHAAAQGIDIVLALGFGNRLYSNPDPARRLPQLWEWYYENPRPPTTPEALAGWARYVRFMCRRLRGRVKVFEVWNEWNIPIYWGEKESLANYLAVARVAIPIIRRECPEAKVMLGSYAGFAHGCAAWSPAEWEAQATGKSLFLGAIRALAKDVDLIGWHPFYQTDPEEEAVRHYRANVEALLRWARRQGFRGEGWCTEYNWGAGYPLPAKPHWWGNCACSELGKAKYVARLSVLHTVLNAGSFFCEVWGNAGYPLDLSLMRRSFGADPIAPLQPQAAYYAMRNLATALDGLRPARFAVDLAGAPPEVEVCTFARRGEKVVALWRTGRAQDECPGLPIRVEIAGTPATASGYDCMNGVTQELRTSVANGRTRLDGILLRDYPLLLRFATNAQG